VTEPGTVSAVEPGVGAAVCGVGAAVPVLGAAVPGVGAAVAGAGAAVAPSGTVFCSDVVEGTVPGMVVLPGFAESRVAEPWDEPDGFTDLEDPVAPFEVFGDEL